MACSALRQQVHDQLVDMGRVCDDRGAACIQPRIHFRWFRKRNADQVQRFLDHVVHIDDGTLPPRAAAVGQDLVDQRLGTMRRRQHIAHVALERAAFPWRRFCAMSP